MNQVDLVRLFGLNQTDSIRTTLWISVHSHGSNPRGIKSAHQSKPTMGLYQSPEPIQLPHHWCHIRKSDISVTSAYQVNCFCHIIYHVIQVIIFANTATLVVSRILSRQPFRHITMLASACLVTFHLWSINPLPHTIYNGITPATCACIYSNLRTSHQLSRNHRRA